MKILLTKDQHNRLMGMKTINESLNDPQIKKVAFSIWDSMKKKGEKPALIDILYDLMDVGKNTYGDYEVIRPIWYEYNGGFDNLMGKVEKEILGKTFILNDEAMGLDTKFKVKEVEIESNDTWPTKFVYVVCEVDKDGMIQYEVYDDEHDEVVLKTDTIEQAMYELEYDKEDLVNYLKGEIYEILGPLTDEKYGVPIYTDIEFTDFN